MNKKEIKKFDTETGGGKEMEKNSVGKEPVLILEDYIKYFDNFKADFNKIKKEINSYKKFTTEVKNLTKRADDISVSFLSLERRIDRTNNFMQWMSGVAVGVFVITGIILIVDYAKNKGDGYKNFIDQVYSLKENYYSKKEVGDILNSFKDCIWRNGLSFCLK